MFTMLRRVGERILYWKFQILTLDNTINRQARVIETSLNAPSLALSS
jgi:hypothetical protein